jgi:transposase
MKTRNRRSYDATFKTKVALEALKETKTLAELASSYDLHPNQIRTWKKEFLANATKAFEGDKTTKQQIEKLEKERDDLYKKVGQRTMEVDFLKKNLKKLNLL